MCNNIIIIIFMNYIPVPSGSPISGDIVDVPLLSFSSCNSPFSGTVLSGLGGTGISEIMTLLLVEYSFSAVSEWI